MVLTEGWDLPEVGCCILARPTKKMGLYRQMIGRVLRPADGKTDAIVLDHSGAVFRHGFVEDPVEWTLDPDRHAENKTHAARGREHGSRLLECTHAAPSALPVRRAAIAGSCRSGRRAMCASRTASLLWSTDHAAPTARSTIRPSASAGTGCSSISARSAATSRAGQPYKYKEKFDDMAGVGRVA